MAKQQKQYEVTFAKGTEKEVTYPVEATSKREAAVINTISSPFLTDKFASSLSLMRIFVLAFADAYIRPKSNLTHKPALKSGTQNLTSFSPKSELLPLFGAEI